MPATASQNLPAHTFGELLRHLRQRSRLTQDELGLAVGYSRAHIARLENSQRVPDPGAVKARFFEPLGLRADSPEAIQLVTLATAAHDIGSPDGDEPEPSAERQTPNNLPYPVTSFVGRTEALAELQRLLPTTRLLTLTGVGGAGKTRLALELASRVLNDYPDGVWLVELAPVADPVLVAPAVLFALNTQDEDSRPPAATLVDYLRDKRLLFLLDNCEHVIAACAELSEAILQSCRNIHILATSRERLGIQGELSWSVPSLSVPKSHELTNPDALDAFEAIQLFVQRAAFAAPGFALTANNAYAVQQICARLDGIPLAIELAASRVKAMTPQTMAERLDDCFRLLTGGSRMALPRHQTLQALIDWSYRLLTEQERSLLRRLSVFANGWTVEAAEHVGSGPDVSSDAVEETLFKLIDKSLVNLDESGAITRYRLLNTIRQYAADRLNEVRETDNVRDRHLRYFLDVGIQLKPELYGMTRADQLASISQVTKDLDNVRSAIDWAINANRGKDVLDLVDRYFVVFLLSGVHAEDRHHLQRLHDRSQGLPPSRLLAEIVVALVRKHRRDGNPDEESRLARELEAIAKNIDDPEVTSWAMAALFWSTLHHKEIATARGLFNSLIKFIEDNRILIDADLNSARDSISNWLLLFEGHFDQATANLEREYAAAKGRRDITEYSWVARQLGYAHLGAHRLTEAKQRFSESLLDNRVCKDIQAVASCLAAFAALAQHAGELDRSARLFSAAEKCHELNRSQPMQWDRMLSSHYMELLREQMHPDSFAEAWQAGRAITLQQAVTLALESESDVA